LITCIDENWGLEMYERLARPIINQILYSRGQVIADDGVPEGITYSRWLDCSFFDLGSNILRPDLPKPPNPTSPSRSAQNAHPTFVRGSPQHLAEIRRLADICIETAMMVPTYGDALSRAEIAARKHNYEVLAPQRRQWEAEGLYQYANTPEGRLLREHDQEGSYYYPGTRPGTELELPRDNSQGYLGNASSSVDTETDEEERLAHLYNSAERLERSAASGGREPTEPSEPDWTSYREYNPSNDPYATSDVGTTSGDEVTETTEADEEMGGTSEDEETEGAANEEIEETTEEGLEETTGDEETTQDDTEDDKNEGDTTFHHDSGYVE
jgi:hypothetical protein